MNKKQDTQPAVRLPGELSFDLKFPPLPRTLAELARLVDNPDETQPISVLKETIAADPIAARLALKRVNSAYYGLRRKVTTAEQAVVLLGFKKVHRLLMTASLVQLRTLFDSEEHAEVYRQMIRHSIMTAGIARRVAEHLRITHAELAYTTGLLHNIGRLVLLYNVPDTYEALWSSCDRGCLPTPEQEKAIFGTTYAKLGSHASAEWNLSDRLVTAVHHQTNPETMATQDPALYKLALVVIVGQETTRDFIHAQGSTPTAEDLREPTSLYALVKSCDTEKEELSDVIVAELEEVQKLSQAMLEE